MALISVIIPVYNGEKYLRECLDSVIKQTLKSIEIIIVNDGSYDNTTEIIREYQEFDKRIRLINKKNTGYANSVNIGIRESCSEYISIIESDDVIKPKMLEILYNKAKIGNFDIVKSSFYLLKDNKYVKFNTFKGVYTKAPHNIMTTPEILTIRPSVWSAIYKKNFLLENQISFNETPGASYQDTSFQFITFYLAKRIYFINAPLYFYRIDNSSSSINSSDKVFDICAEFDVINNFLKDNYLNSQIENQKILFELRAYLWNLNRIKDKYVEGFLDKICNTMQEYDLQDFYRDKNIPKKEKTKLKLLLMNKYIFYVLFKLSKLMRK